MRENLGLLVLFFTPVCYKLLEINREIGFTISFVLVIFGIVLLFIYNDTRKEVKSDSTKKLILIFLSYVILCYPMFVADYSVSVNKASFVTNLVDLGFNLF